MKPALDGAAVLSSVERPGNETLAGRIAEKIKRQIVTGQLKPGQKLVEKEIARGIQCQSHAASRSAGSLGQRGPCRQCRLSRHFRAAGELAPSA